MKVKTTCKNGGNFKEVDKFFSKSGSIPNVGTHIVTGNHEYVVDGVEINFIMQVVHVRVNELFELSREYIVVAKMERYKLND